MCLLFVCLDNIRTTRLVCGLFSSSWAEYSTISLVSSFFCPSWVQWVSVIPNTAKLYLLISAAIWLVLSVSHIVQTFYVPISSVALIIRRAIGLVISKEFRFLSRRVIILPLTPREQFKWFNLFDVIGASFSRIIVYGMRWLGDGAGRSSRRVTGEVRQFLVIL